MDCFLIFYINRANRIFTDREEPRKIFWDTYNLFKENPDKPNDIKVITYYGIGGIGKTCLLQQLRKELVYKIEKPQYIYIDFNTTKDTRAVLKNMRNKLKNEYNFELTNV